MLCGTLFAVRILVDYRPALRERTGVGEFVHELVQRAGSAVGPPTTSHSSPAHGRTGRTPALASEMPSIENCRRQGSGSGAGLVVESAGMAAGRMVRRGVRRRSQPESAADSRAASAAQVVTVHDLDFLRHPEHMSAEIRRDYPALARVTRGARRRRDRVLALCRRRSHPRAAASIRCACTSARPDGRHGPTRSASAAGRRAPVTARAGTSSSWAP